MISIDRLRYKLEVGEPPTHDETKALLRLAKACLELEDVPPDLHSDRTAREACEKWAMMAEPLYDEYAQALSAFELGKKSEGRPNGKGLVLKTS